MIKKILPMLLGIIMSSPVFAQMTPIDVTDQTIKIGGMSEEVMYFGFAEGDQVIFSFSEINGKELKEIEILEYPSNSKFSDFKTARVDDKKILVNKKAVYKFRFSNGALGGRICKIKIQRIPAAETTKGFITNVNWITKQDTTWNVYTKDVVIGYDTTKVPKKKKELVKTEQKEELIFDKSQRVHSLSNENPNKTSLFFVLPQNINTPYKTQKVIAWAYWIGVGEEAAQAWSTNVKAVGKLAGAFTTPLGAYAINAITELAIPKIGEDVYYSVTDNQNSDLFRAGQPYRLFDEGKGVAGYKKFTNAGMLQGTWYINMSNDNSFQGIDANVKVIAIIETNTYEDKEYTELVVTPKLEKKIFRDPVINTQRVPVTEM